MLTGVSLTGVSFQCQCSRFIVKAPSTHCYDSNCYETKEHRITLPLHHVVLDASDTVLSDDLPEPELETWPPADPADDPL